jgi:hypothetical protein
VNDKIPKPVSVTVNPTFREVFIASLTLIRYRKAFILLHSIFPLAGLFLLVSPFIFGEIPPWWIFFFGLLALLFTPLVTALAVWNERRRNKLAVGPFTYSFDSQGMHTTGTAFSQTIQWSAITRVRQSKRFVFIFISPSRAFCISVADLTNQRVLDEVRNIIAQHIDK